MELAYFRLNALMMLRMMKMMMAWSSMTTILNPFTISVSADPLLEQIYLLDGLSSSCANALTADTSCRQSILSFQAGDYYPESHLHTLCTEACASSLAAYHHAVVSSCAADTWEGYGDQIQPVAIISEMLRYHYNASCLVDDGGRFCNNVAAAFAAAADSGAANDTSKLPAGGRFGDHDTSNSCDTCVVKNLAFRAGSPYYDGPRLQSQSVYQSKTSSCGITDAPLTTTQNSILPSPTQESPTTSTTTTTACAGTTYAIQPSDDCFSISTAQKIGTEWLLGDNDLLAYCHDFPTEGELCLVNTCEVYMVLESDSCKSIAKAHSITEAQLRAWNPTINAGCYNLEKMVGFQICVSKPGTPYVEPAPTTIAPSIPTTAAPVPTNIAGDTNPHCGRFYEARLGDYCNQIIVKFSISLADFRFLNPAINENCTNLYAQESYCVQAVGDINTYPGKPGAVSYVLTFTSGMQDVATALPNNTWTAPAPTRTSAPLAPGTQRDCASYLLGDEWQTNITDTQYASHCHFVADVMSVSLDDLEVWNPSLGNTSSPECTFASGFRFCGRQYLEARYEMPSGLDEPLSLAREGMHENCTVTIDVTPDGSPSCQEILSEYDLTIAQFYAMNPSVGNDCAGLWAGYFYCIRVPSYENPRASVSVLPSSAVAAATTSSKAAAAATTPTGPTPPAPTLDGQPADCNKWHVVAAGEDCGVIETKYSLSQAQFRKWNTAVSEDCTVGFWGGYAYCVGLQ